MWDDKNHCRYDGQAHDWQELDYDVINHSVTLKCWKCEETKLLVEVEEE